MTENTLVGPTLALLRRIRALMQSEVAVQARLDQFVEVIAAHMQADVASIYLQRGGGSLELCATEGLDKVAVHKTRLESGQGLVGQVAYTARPLNLAEAKDHPMFAYKPETGEDKFRSFLGVPILRGGRTLGVLVIQSINARSFNEVEVETLQTVAMILAEIAVEDERAGGAKRRLKGIALIPSKPEYFKGKTFSGGLTRGQAYLHVAPTLAGKLIADNPQEEEARLNQAISRLRASVDIMVSGEAASLSRASKEIFEAYRLFAYDRKWVERLREAVQSGLTAEAAVERVRNEHRARLMKARDPYLRARLHDLEDLANRLLRMLSGEMPDGGKRETGDNAILFARDLGPAELLDYDLHSLVGVVLEEGSPSSHMAIICRAMGLPLLGRAEGVLDQIETGDNVLLDCEQATVFIRPLENQIDSFDMRLGVLGEMAKVYEAQRGIPAVTKDGRAISLQLNAGLLVDMPHLLRFGADGIGLFRTEFQFMVSEVMPRMQAQTDFYRKAIESAKGKPVTFRTLDLGGDKILPYSEPVPEENPALGWRSIRIALDRPGLMRYQLRALISAGEGELLRIMFPMVATVDEFISAKALVMRELQRASQLGHSLPRKVEIGVMLETPALAWATQAICRYADFVSVGANDLMQFFFAADRDNARVSDRYDPLHPASLSMLKFIADSCHRNDTPISLCGEMAGRPLEACALIALGFDTLSMSVTGIGPVKAATLALDAAKLKSVIEPLLRFESPVSSLRNAIAEFCEGEGIPV
ncbi:phosphoenolpyruvate--protein phosphotransferase [Robiginitomaculum antarcticum]|uniref:phosphoenolpyruvate--protein phosphotransferase n=1 Tax=Robiginitomaculum antarcticum TaxID=437507 RepID=UPI0003745D8E|nr:phosphoenolpyruvate--protein phosphotransferase [Robiginitomaculum antarcticum]